MAEENTIFTYHLSEDGEHILLDRTMPKGDPGWQEQYYETNAKQRVEKLKHGFYIIGKRFKGALL